MQSVFWLIAGISAAPFVLGGEVFMAGLAVATLLLALGTCMGAIGVLWRRTWARVAVIALEVTCLFGSAVLLLVPLRFNRGLRVVFVNEAVPVGVIGVVWKDGEASASPLTLSH